ncbi:unnamed protein product, partial [Wuchereria bancrofti]
MSSSSRKTLSLTIYKTNGDDDDGDVGGDDGDDVGGDDDDGGDVGDDD